MVADDGGDELVMVAVAVMDGVGAASVAVAVGGTGVMTGSWLI